MPLKSVAKTAANRGWQVRHGYVQMNSWVPSSLRDEINALCRERGWSRLEFLLRALTALTRSRGGGMNKDEERALLRELRAVREQLAENRAMLCALLRQLRAVSDAALARPKEQK